MKIGSFVFFSVVFFLCIRLFQPNSVAAKLLLEGKSHRGSDSVEFHHRTGNRGKDKATDSSSRTTHYRASQLPAKSPTIDALPLSDRQKQQRASSNFYHTNKGELSNTSTVNNFNCQGHTRHLSVPPAARGQSHLSRIRRHSDSTHRHLSQVSHVPERLAFYKLNGFDKDEHVYQIEQF